MKRLRQTFIAANHAFVVLMACVLSAPLPAQQTAPSAIAAGPGSLDGIWLNAAYKKSATFSERDRVLHTLDGKFPPMLPWASELLNKRIKDSEGGLPFANTLALCLPGGVPLMLFGDAIPVQILETPEQLTMLFMEGNRFRVIPINASHPKDVDPSYMGDAVARWQGDTLVIDDVGFKPVTTLDQIGMPHTDKLHVIERYRRTGKDSMQIRVSIDDPGTFTQPWDAEVVNYKLAPAGTRMVEDVCENNRNPSDAQGRSGFKHF